MGIFFALLCACFQSLQSVFSKKSLKKADEYIASFFLYFFALLFLLIQLFFIKIPSLNENFWIALFTSGGLNVIAIIFYMKAIKNSDLSLVMPMLSFTPLFLLLISPIVVKEFPNLSGGLGVVFVVIGLYVLNVKDISNGFFEPFKAITREKGTRYMLFAAFLWSVSSNFDKIGVQNSSPAFWPIAIFSFLSLIMFIIVLVKSSSKIKQVSNYITTSFIPLGLFMALTVVFQSLAINLTLVAYVISIKRASIVLSVVFGYFLFHEKEIKDRLIGSVIMLAGIVIIALS